MANVILGSVGQGGANNASDVRVTQRLLNDSLAREKQMLLKVDGIVGPKTISAISNFQKKNGSIVDGRVDPMGPTILKLFQQHLVGLMGNLYIGRFGINFDKGALTPASFSDPTIALLIQQYADALRKDA
ncbi:peptidoglycan-binding protein [Methylosinus sp. LW3]|uniref:peptidoglycan-binding domain-containing protein n=1 Tax=Methylosinus sp. LW3 TaxID=107635 RepID=UPI0004671F79|nr:peptidoglycan-binding protein [Methylosinus sp. LW3]